jgi:hypothetical protein
MVSKISCGEKNTDVDFKALSQEERKYLDQLVKVVMQDGDKLSPEADARERACHMVQTMLIDCD